MSLLVEPCRRDFLAVTGTAAAALLLGACGGIRQGTFPVADASSLAVGASRLVEEGPFILARDEGGLYAMSARCTHMGCTVAIEGDRLPCHCHGSVFDLGGQVVEGPAREPLQHFRVVVTDGAVTVDTTQPVEAAVRTPAGG